MLGDWLAVVARWSDAHVHAPITIVLDSKDDLVGADCGGHGDLDEQARRRPRYAPLHARRLRRRRSVARRDRHDEPDTLRDLGQREHAGVVPVGVRRAAGAGREREGRRRPRVPRHRGRPPLLRRGDWPHRCDRVANEDRLLLQPAAPAGAGGERQRRRLDRRRPPLRAAGGLRRRHASREHRRPDRRRPEDAVAGHRHPRHRWRPAADAARDRPRRVARRIRGTAAGEGCARHAERPSEVGRAAAHRRRAAARRHRRLRRAHVPLRDRRGGGDPVRAAGRALARCASGSSRSSRSRRATTAARSGTRSSSPPTRRTGRRSPPRRRAGRSCGRGVSSRSTCRARRRSPRPTTRAPRGTRTYTSSTAALA